MGVAVQVREYDGGRGVEFEQCGDFIIMESGYHAFAFDAALMLHAMRRLFAERLDRTLP